MPAEKLYEDEYNGAAPADKTCPCGSGKAFSKCHGLIEDEEPKEVKVVHLPILKPSGPPPRTRGDCLPGGSNAARPCQWITCRWYLPRMTPNPKFTCALDVADSGGVTLEEVGELMGITRERVRQIEEKVMRRIKQRDAAYNKRMLQKLVEDAPGSKGWDYHI